MPLFDAGRIKRNLLNSMSELLSNPVFKVVGILSPRCDPSPKWLNCGTRPRYNIVDKFLNITKMTP